MEFTYVTTENETSFDRNYRRYIKDRGKNIDDELKKIASNPLSARLLKRILFDTQYGMSIPPERPKHVPAIKVIRSTFYPEIDLSDIKWKYSLGCDAEFITRKYDPTKINPDKKHFINKYVNR